ncbi:MAG: hypothetical protein GF350_15835 [Chitinivibrionales bacterium]|nr:hypothetical protein [Chitinivibrionales bacterium]
MRKLLCSLIMYCSFLSAEPCAQPADSLEYYQKRNELQTLKNEQIRTAIRAADELAEQEFYTEALDLLNEISPAILREDSPDTPPEKKEPAAEVIWRILSGADYYYLEDISKSDTSDQEARDSIQVLQEEPFALYGKASLEFLPRSVYIHSLKPSVYIANNRTSVGAGAEFRFFEKWVHAEIYGKAEKQLMRNDEFHGDSKDTSDLLEYETRLEIQNLHRDGLIGFSAPFSINNRIYRNNRPGRVSLRDYSGNPFVEYTSGDFKKTFNTGVFWQYKDYYDRDTAIPDSNSVDSLDVYRIGPTITANMLFNRITAGFLAGFLHERFTQSNTIDMRNEYELTARIRAKINELFLVALAADYLYNHEEYDQAFAFSITDTVYDTIPPGIIIPSYQSGELLFPTDYSLFGSFTKFVPGIEITPSPFLLLSLDMPVSYRNYNAVDPVGDSRFAVTQYIEENSIAFEPQIGLRIAPEHFDFRIYCAYLHENIYEKAYYYESSNRGIRTGGALYWLLFDLFALSGSGEFQRKHYEKDNRVSNNASVSFSVSVKL